MFITIICRHDVKVLDQKMISVCASRDKQTTSRIISICLHCYLMMGLNDNNVCARTPHKCNRKILVRNDDGTSTEYYRDKRGVLYRLDDKYQGNNRFYSINSRNQSFIIIIKESVAITYQVLFFQISIFLKNKSRFNNSISNTYIRKV